MPRDSSRSGCGGAAADGAPANVFRSLFIERAEELHLRVRHGLSCALGMSDAEQHTTLYYGRSIEVCNRFLKRMRRAKSRLLGQTPSITMSTTWLIQ